MQRPFPYCYWVEPARLLAGQYPGDRDDALALAKVRALLHSGVSCFLDLTEEGELRPYEPSLRQEATNLGVRVEHRRFPMRDLSAPGRATMVAALDALEGALGSRRVVYVHCMAGIGRTGMVVGCYLVRRGMTGKDAIAHIAKLRADLPGMRKPAPETDVQQRFVEQWRE
jgi:hypothetical protein